MGPTFKAIDVNLAASNSTSTVVISQVYGGGGNAGATLRNDFIELFNRGTESVTLDGWSVQYASSAGGSWQRTLLSGTIAAGQYVLIQEAAQGGGSVSLVADIVTGPGLPAGSPIPMAAGAGKVALVRNTTFLTCSTAVTCAPFSGVIADFVGFGGASFFEGAAPTGALSNTTAAIRKNAGCTDTDENGADFAIGLPTPRNRATAPNICPSDPVEPPGAVTSVTITPTDATFFLGSAPQFSAVGKDAAGRTSPTTFTWTSSDPGTLSFGTAPNTTGLALTALVSGQVTITATAANGVVGTTRATLAERVVATVSVAINDERRIPVGFTKPAFATARDASGAPITNPAPAMTWSSSNELVATVDNLGYIQGVGVGTATISARASTGTPGSNIINVIPANAPTTAIYRNHVEFGSPTPGTSSDDVILSKPQYVLSYNRTRGGPNWVSSNLNKSHFGEAERCNCFSADPTLPAGIYRVVDFDYRDGGYDRGHMVQSEPRTTTDQENASTFLLTNILPQAGNNNQGPWSKFENHLNDLARDADDPKEIYIVTGGQYGPSPATLKGQGKVHVPDYTWKAAVVMKAGQGLADVTSAADVEILAVRMPNDTLPGVVASAFLIRPDPWEKYAVTVDQIEAAIGYDLLSNLPDHIERALEAGDRAPVAVLSGPSTGTEGSALLFSAGLSTDPDFDALTYAWNFGDGTTSTDASPNHTFADNATYTVTLRVTDPAGADAIVSRIVEIDNAKPVVNSLVATSIVSGEEVSAVASFSDAGARDMPWTYTFNWDSGTPTTGVAHTTGVIGATKAVYAAGSHTVSFTVTDKDGSTSAVRTATFDVSRIGLGLLVSPDQITIANNGNGQVKVVVLGTPQLDASLIDAESARIGNAAADAKGNEDLKSKLQDIEGDGDMDLILHFVRRELVRNGALSALTTQLTLLANLTDGRQIQASGNVEVNANAAKLPAL